jgi:hypothetical protein
LIDGKAQITPKEDGTIDPAQLLKATYDSGVTAAEMVITARGRIVKDSSGSLALQVEPNRSFALVPNELSKGLDSLEGTQTMVTVRGQLYKKLPGKQKIDTPIPLKLLILEVEKKGIDATQMVVTQPDGWTRRL